MTNPIYEDEDGFFGLPPVDPGWFDEIALRFVNYPDSGTVS